MGQIHIKADEYAINRANFEISKSNEKLQDRLKGEFEEKLNEQDIRLNWLEECKNHNQLQKERYYKEKQEREYEYRTDFLGPQSRDKIGSRDGKGSGSLECGGYEEYFPVRDAQWGEAKRMVNVKSE
jgi:hypothetical protein